MVLAALYLVTDLKGVPDAGATGGAFTSTKHGGADVDGESQPGVDRSVNPEVGVFYYDVTDAGEYEPGECNHCHEPHASFGGSEPRPFTTEPHSYLLFRDNDNTLCWYCHENINFDPFFNGGVGRWKFYQGKAIFEDSSHESDPNFTWPGDTDLANDGTIWPRDYGNQARPNADFGKCINCHTPHGIKDASNTPGHDFGTISTSNYVVGTDPTANDKELIYRQAIAREEALCLNCHDHATLGPATGGNIKAQVEKWGFVAPVQYDTAEGSGHPVRETSYYDRHDLADEDPGSISSGWFTTGSRHAECTDCHNPHAARGRGSGMTSPDYGFVFQPSGGTSWNSNRYDTASDSTSSPVKVGPVNQGVWGVTVTPSSGDITGTVEALDPVVGDRLYQLCLKCHSYWAWGGSNVATSSGTAQSPLWNAPSTDSSLTWTDLYAGSPPRTDLSFTNIAWEFATDGNAPATKAGESSLVGRTAHHAVFGQGRHRPEEYTEEFASGVRNPCWCEGTNCRTAKPTVASYLTAGEGTYGTGDCSNNNGGSQLADGTRTDVSLSTLSQNFVPPWLHTSYVTCVDCHEDSSESTARGPHGSSRPFILRKLDCSISFSVRGTPSTVTYTDATLIGSGCATGTAQYNLCINCHRADVYGFDNISGEAANANFARQNHHDSFDDGVGRVFGGNNGDSPNGIVCMRCHGAAGKKLGVIHGNDYTEGATDEDPSVVCSTCTTSGRLIAAGGDEPNSGAWNAFRKSAVGSIGSCQRAEGTDYCGNAQDGAFRSTGTANYNY
jgi:hypothetical protein